MVYWFITELRLSVSTSKIQLLHHYQIVLILLHFKPVESMLQYLLGTVALIIQVSIGTILIHLKWWYSIYRKISSIRHTKSQNLHDIISPWNCLYSIHWNQVLSWEWTTSEWSTSLFAYQAASYITVMTALSYLMLVIMIKYSIVKLLKPVSVSDHTQIEPFHSK